MSCLFCKSSSRLLVSTLCGHRVCSFCLQRQLLSGPFPCPECKTVLARNSFREVKSSTFEKEIKIRKRLAKVFNKREKDFDDLEAYYKYEEWVEDIMYNIVHDIEKPKYEALVTQYKNDNQAFIIKRNQELEKEAADEKKRQKDEDFQRKIKERDDLIREIEEEKEKQKERERVLTKVQVGEITAKDLEKNMEDGMKRRKRRKEEEEQKMKEAKVEVEEEEEEKPSEFVPKKLVQKMLPKPIGMSKFEAERPQDQKAIQSHAGVVSDAEMEELLKKFECCGYTRETIQKRAKAEAQNKFELFQ